MKWQISSQLSNNTTKRGPIAISLFVCRDMPQMITLRRFLWLPGPRWRDTRSPGGLWGSIQLRGRVGGHYTLTSWYPETWSVFFVYSCTYNRSYCPHWNRLNITQNNQFFTNVIYFIITKWYSTDRRQHDTILYIWTKRNFVLRDDFSLRRAFSKSKNNSLCNRASSALLHSPIRVLWAAYRREQRHLKVNF